MDTTGTASTRGEAVLVNKGRCAQREGRYGRNGTAWTQQGRRGHNRDGADNKVRFGQNKVRHGQNRKQIFVLSPAFHYLCGETDAGPAGRIRQNLCGYAFENGLCCLCDKLETMKEERLILVTNDDGYDSKGLAAAVEVARGFGRVVVVAPETTQSGMSQAITMYNPLYLRCVRKEEGLEVYAFSGTPVDCVKMAFDYLLREERVDLVISGINHGSNSAVNVLYSGTMGAAIEGSFYGCPAVGLSLDDHGEDADFEAAVAYGRRIVGSVLENRIELPLCLNVNVPVGRPDELHGIRLCRQNRGFWREEFYRHEDPRGREYFWLTGAFVNEEPEAQDTDEWALSPGYVSVVPVQVDLTDDRQLGALAEVLK